MRLLNQALFFKTVCCSCGNFTLTSDLYISIETGGYPPVLKCQGIGHTIGHFFSLKGILGGYPPALKCIGHSLTCLMSVVIFCHTKQISSEV